MQASMHYQLLLLPLLLLPCGTYWDTRATEPGRQQGGPPPPPDPVAMQALAHSNATKFKILAAGDSLTVGERGGQCDPSCCSTQFITTIIVWLQHTIDHQ